MHLQESMDQLKIQQQNEISSKDTEIHQLEFSLEKLKDNPNIDEFRKEALELNTLLAQQQVIFFKNYQIFLNCVRKEIH